jgi:arginine decarboxylase
MTATAHDGHDQTSTPYLDAMLRYRDAHFTPFHTPGHKLGKGAPAGLIEALGLQLLQVDVAMAGGIEDTRESTHLLWAAERLAAEAYGADECHFLVNGSTSGVQSLVMTLAGPGDTVIVPRNSHKSLLAGLIFSGAMPYYIEPPTDSLWGIPLNVSLDDVEAALRAVPDATALFVTSPTYNGFGAHLRAIAELVHAAGLPFVVDQAWGPHFRFCSLLPDDAMSAGADAAVASTHKLISGLTQSSVLMANRGRLNLERLASIVKMTQSTSPQTLMYVSIDAARAQMATQGEELWSRALELADWARARIDQIEGLRCLGDECLHEPGVAAFDATRLTITACDLGHSGWQLESILRDDYRIAVEAADPLNIVLNVTYGDSRQDVERLVSALADYAARYRERAGNATACGHEHLLIKLPPFTRQVLSPRDAFFARSVALPLRECLGHVSAEIVTPYPPGIPVLGPGEEIGPQTVIYLEEARDRQLTVHGPEDVTLRTLLVVE